MDTADTMDVAAAAARMTVDGRDALWSALASTDEERGAWLSVAARTQAHCDAAALAYRKRARVREGRGMAGIDDEAVEVQGMTDRMDGPQWIARDMMSAAGMLDYGAGYLREAVEQGRPTADQLVQARELRVRAIELRNAAEELTDAVRSWARGIEQLDEED